MGKLVSFRNYSSVAGGMKAAGKNTPVSFTGSPEELVEQLKPSLPMYILNTNHIENTAKNFMNAFPGKTMFAVKTNPHPAVIAAMYRAGMMHFDVASLEEIQIVRANAPQAEIYYMHPAKSPEAIKEAYTRYGVRHFVLDCADELYKIIRETGLATDLKLYVRLALPKNAEASIDLSSKFGAMPLEAAELLRKCRTVSEKLGLCFHVGTQIHDVSVFGRALQLAKTVIDHSGVKVDILDVGGGFPVTYIGEDVPSIEACMDTIKQAIRKHGLSDLELMAEPGRALVAEGGMLIARVELRKGNVLYINDGTYGGLFDAGPLLGTRFPVKAVRDNGNFTAKTAGFSLAGPTCDSLDMMAGPFDLPADIRMGDWIIFENTGAYSQSMRTNFNGFGACETVFLHTPLE